MVEYVLSLSFDSWGMLLRLTKEIVVALPDGGLGGT